jgi:hypothetical protein
MGDKNGKDIPKFNLIEYVQYNVNTGVYTFFKTLVVRNSLRSQDKGGSLFSGALLRISPRTSAQD